jgi:predicted dehydrogenase
MTDPAPVRIGIVGSGWRTQTFLRIARQAPMHFQVTGVVTRSSERGAEVSSEWGVPTFRSLEDLLQAAPTEYIVASVPWPVTPHVIKQCAELGVYLLTETPPAPDRDGLRELWESVKDQPRIQVAEQYLLMPRHAARRVLAEQGVIGEVTSVQVSSTHGYHAVSMIRHLLQIGFASATVRASSFMSPLANPLGRDGWTGHATPQELPTVIATLDFGEARMGLYDFTFDQWYNPLRSRRIVIRGTLGEIVDDDVVRIVDPTTILESKIIRRMAGKDLDVIGFDLDHVSHEGEVLYRNPFFGARLSEDDLAIAEILARMGKYCRGDGPAVYSLADGCQDHLLGLAIEEAATSGRSIVVGPEKWAF